MEIVLSTLNARFHHSAFGLRYLYANLEELQTRAEILEFIIKRNPKEIVDEILKRNPKIVGFGIYIWNTKETAEVLKLLRSRRSDLCIVLGGPEISYETETQEIFQLCDYVIRGEADFLFRDFCRDFLSGSPPANKIIAGPRPEIQNIQLPYFLYSESDIKNRVLYVEASRGCPYKCEYCLSSLDEKVRDFDIEIFLSEMAKLIDRGARTFKFVDRTFNLSISKSSRILNFFLERIHLGLFLHFELVPDRLPSELRDLIQKFPKGSLQFEIGVQTMNSSVAAKISRRQNYEKIRENFRFLREETGVHTHADLIVGLPGETMESFAVGFDELAKMRPDEIQVGILKRLKGTPIVRHDETEKVVWSNEPPFTIISNRCMSKDNIDTMKNFADVWDFYWNSGRFPNFVNKVNQLTFSDTSHSLFSFVLELSLHFFQKFGRTYGVSLDEQFVFLQNFLIQVKEWPIDEVRDLLAWDYLRDGRSVLPRSLRKEIGDYKFEIKKQIFENIPARQRRHLDSI